MAKINKNNKAGLIPYIFIAFFATFILADIAFFIIAKNTWRGVQTQNSYKKGRQYNDTLQKVKQQQSLGWSIESKLKQTRDNHGELFLCLLNRNKVKIANAKVKVRLSFPVQDGLDFEQQLIQKNSCYATKIFFPKKGQWQFEFIVIKNDNVFQDVKRYIIR